MLVIVTRQALAFIEHIIILGYLHCEYKDHNI